MYANNSPFTLREHLKENHLKEFNQLCDDENKIE